MHFGKFESEFFKYLYEGNDNKDFEIYCIQEITHNVKNFYSDNKIYYSMNSVLGKLFSMRYHFFNYQKFEHQHIKKARYFSKKIAFKGLAIEYEKTDLTSEFEAFLFQAKACLDIFSRAVGEYYNQNPSNIKKLTNLLYKQNDDKSKKILNIIKKNIWLKDFQSDDNFKKSLRDIIAHYGQIGMSHLQIDLRETTKKKRVKRYHYKNKSVKCIMRKYYYGILNLISEIYFVQHKETTYSKRKLKLDFSKEKRGFFKKFK